MGDIAIVCRGYSVSNTFISATICRRSKFLNENVKHRNFLSKRICEEKAYLFIAIIVTLKPGTFGKMVYIY